MNRPRRRRASAHTLVELLVSMTILTMIMTGLVSAVLIGSHALPERNSALARAVSSTEFADRLAEELSSAIWITERQVAATTFTVPDRDGDGLPERIRYAWSGTAGHPLTRQYNGGRVANVLADVHDLQLTYELKTTTEEYLAPSLPGPETELVMYNSNANLSSARVEDGQWWAQYFKPSLAPSATGWSVTRVRFMARRDQALLAQTLIELRLPNADNRPSDTVVDQAVMPQLALTDNYQLMEKSFSNATGLSPDSGLCLAFMTSDESSCRLLHQSSGVVLPNAAFIRGDPAWEVPATDKALVFYVYGAVSTPGSPRSATRRYVSAVSIALQAGSDRASRVVTATRTLNNPELLSGLWQLDFDADPTLDHNGDGAPDWSVHDERSFDLGTLLERVWRVDTQIDTYPDNDFAELTTVEVRFRDRNAADDKASFRINADWSGASYAPLVANVQLEANDTQTCQVLHMVDNINFGPLKTISGLPGGFVTLRLLIDPELNTVNIKVNGQEQGTFIYNRVVPFTDDRFASILDTGADVEFDHVSVRVGEAE